MRPPLPIFVSKALDQLLALLKMSDYEADEYQDRLEEHADRRFDPQSRRKIQSMGQRESKPRFSRFSNRKTILDDRKQKERDLKLRRERAIMGLDPPYSFHGFGADDREMHPGEEGNYTEEMWKKLQSMRGKVRSPTVGRSERAVRIESPEDLSRLFIEVGPGIYERNPNPESNLPWTTSGPINYIPQTEEWVNNPFEDIPTNRGIPFNEETGFTKGNSKELKGCPINMGEAFSEAWDVLKMGFPPSNGPPSPSPSPPSKPPNGGGQEEYSHKDLDAESLIDFLIQTLHMDYQDAKVLVNHHKTKELAGASQRKAKAAAEETLDEAPPSPQMGAPPMGMGKPPMSGPI